MPTQQKASTSDPPSVNPVAERELDDDEGTLKRSIEDGNFVLVSWKNKLFPGVVITIDENNAIVDCMEPTNKTWKWPREKDISHYKWCGIIRKITSPTQMKRGFVFSSSVK